MNSVATSATLALSRSRRGRHLRWALARLTIVASNGPARAEGHRPPEIAALVAAMPYLEPAFTKFESGWGDEPPGLYIYVDVIFQWLNPLLEERQAVDPRFFGWLEALATSTDEATRMFLSAGLLEVMGDHPRWLERLRSQMGPATVLCSIETEASWGRPEPENR